MVRQAPHTTTKHTMFIVAPIHHESEKCRETRLISYHISLPACDRDKLILTDRDVTPTESFFHRRHLD
jgi:hypothetical protein